MPDFSRNGKRRTILFSAYAQAANTPTLVTNIPQKMVDWGTLSIQDLLGGGGGRPPYGIRRCVCVALHGTL